MSTEQLVGFIVSIILAVFGSTGFWTWAMNRKKKKDDGTRLLLGLAYSKIIETATFYLNRGYIEADEYRELEHYLYLPYKNMGGDGTAEKMMNEVKKLPNVLKEETK